MTITLMLNGWVHVHTWHESHGEYRTDIFQKEPDTQLFGQRRVELLEVSSYYDGRTNNVRLGNDHDYLLARDIRANPTRYQVISHHTEACATAGHDNFRDLKADKLYRIFGAAGHSEWAFEIQEEDLGPETPYELIAVLPRYAIRGRSIDGTVWLNQHGYGPKGAALLFYSRNEAIRWIEAEQERNKTRNLDDKIGHLEPVPVTEAEYKKAQDDELADAMAWEAEHADDD